jgi:hypothetical protein
MPTVITQGAGSAQGFGFAARSTAANYIEDVFSTYLYTGNGSTQTITNEIDLSTKGGMVWLKSRSAATNNFLFDTSRGVLNELNSNTRDAQASLAASLTAFNTTGFSLGAAAGINVNAATYASWTFRKQAKFFDVVTYTGNGSTLSVSHSLSSAPGSIFIKNINSSGFDWFVYHRSLYDSTNGFIRLNSTDTAYDRTTSNNFIGQITSITSSSFSVVAGVSANTLNINGDQYVAYLFAHDAGGFGASGADNVISCGSFTASGGLATVTLGYEPQWLMVKQSDGAGSWGVYDTMRGIPTGSDKRVLFPNTAVAETSGNNPFNVTATGFDVTDSSAFPGTGSGTETFIYIAIRRGPMRTPTSGTSVFEVSAITPSTGTLRTTGFPADLLIGKTRNLVAGAWWTDRLRGFINSNATSCVGLSSSSTNAELAQYPDEYDVWNISSRDGQYFNTYPIARYRFRRAPGFFDEVCYTGTASARTINHNLGVVPEMIIVKNRANGASLSIGWYVYNSNLGGNTKFLQLNTTTAVGDDGGGYWNSTSPTASVFSLGSSNNVNYNGGTFVAYLFASCPGVSKVGSYTGTGTTQTINCGFTAGARFVLIKRTDSTGDWYVWDSARGIVAGNDPHLSLNTTAAEVTTDDSVDTDSTGFVVNQVAATNINVTSASYIFLAVS